MKNFYLIKKYLDYYRTLEIRNSIKKDFLVFISCIIIFLLLTSLFGTIFYFNLILDKTIKFLFIFIIVFIFIKIALDFILWKRKTYEELALRIENKSPEFNNHLINSWQLSTKDNHGTEVLIKKIREDTALLIKKTDVSKTLNKKNLLLYRNIAFIGIAFLCLCVILFPESFRKTVSSLFLPFSDLALSVNPLNHTGKTSITKIDLTYVFPEYTGMSEKKEEIPLSDISCLTGTILTIKPVFNNKVGKVFLLFGDGSFLKSKEQGNNASFCFKVTNSTLYEFKYYDFLTGEYITTQKHILTANFDSAPYVQFTIPGRNIIVKNLNVNVPLQVIVSDKFGAGILSMKYHIGSGPISQDDPVFFKTNLENVKSVTISTFLKIPSDISTGLSYYAECTDNNPIEPETGRSSVFFIYPPSFMQKQSYKDYIKKQNENEKEAKLKMEEIKKQLTNFITSQTSIIKAAKKIGEPKNLAGKQKLKNLAENEKKWLQTLQEMMNDLNNLGSQTRGKFTLANEFVEMVDHVQSAEYGMIKPAVTIAVTQAEMGLELAKEITSNIEKWLAESPDNVNWKMPALPPGELNVPEAPLPSELEDMIGNLINNEQDMQNNIEETTSKWMDSLNKGAGWGVMDGPISNMSAKGITGNIMPGSQEVGGRSGEGRTGRSYGEMVGNTAIGKGGRLTPAELTPDNLEPGIINDKSGQNSLGPTGGGKISGLGPEGLQGPLQENFFAYNLYATQQKKLVEKAEALERSMTVFNVYNPQLQKAISAMKEFHIEIKEGRYKDLLTTTHFIISNLKQTQNVMIKNAIITMGNSERISKEKYSSTGIWDEKIPPGYEKVIWKYYSKIFNH